MPRLPEDQKLKIIRTVFDGKQTIAQAARQFDISRTSLYEWLNKFTSQGNISNQIVRGKSHPRKLNLHLEQRLWELVSQHPTKSIGELYKLTNKRGLRIGRHGLQNFLVRNGLNTREKRLQWVESKVILFKTSAKGKLTGRDRLHYIEEILTGERTVSSISRETGVSRFSLYEWLHKYKKGGENEASLTPLYKKSSDHYKFLPEKIVNQILDSVIVSPDLPLTKLFLKVNTAGVKVGRHGVQNVLARYNLNTLESRRLYAREWAGWQKIVPRTGEEGRIAPLIEQLTPNLLPAPPPSLELRRASPPEAPPSLRDLFFIFLNSFRSLFRQLITLPLKQGNTLKAAFFAFSLPVVLSLTTLGIWNYFKIFIDSPSLSVSIGYVFASIALGLGMFFFLYSFKYYASVVLVLMFSRNIAQGDEKSSQLAIGSSQLELDRNIPDSSALLRTANYELITRSSGLIPDISGVTLDRHPFVSIHLPLYNEKRVVNRLLEAVTSMEYDNFEVIVADDSTDETKDIVLDWKNHPKVKISHRDTRQGFKGGALREALKFMDKRTEFVLVFDSDFLPYPDTITQFLKYFQATAGTLNFQKGERVKGKGEIEPSSPFTLHPSPSPIAAIQGYQWHVLNKSENWITRGVRSEYAGSYVVERSSAEIYHGLKQIAGSVYMIRADILKAYGWGDSITEDFELTLKLYRDGYKVVYTPYIQAPSECVSTLKRLVRQRMRWAEGHSHNVKRLFWNLLLSNKTEKAEKFEFLYLSPYYLQSFFFLIGTLFWFLSETVFHVRLPFWTAVWGWSLVLTNMLSLPLMNMVGMFLEEAEEKDYMGLLSFVLLTYIVAPFQAYASVKGFLEKEEGPWFRTPKTGKITDIYRRGRFYRWLTGIFGESSPSVARLGTNKLAISSYLSSVTANKLIDSVIIKPRHFRWLGNVMLVLFLISTLLLTSLSGLIPKVKTVSASPGNLVTIEDVKSGKIAKNLSKIEEITTPRQIQYPVSGNEAIEIIFHKEPRVRIKVGQKELEITTKTIGEFRAHPKRSLIKGDNKVVYEDIIPNVDLVYTPTREGFEEKFIVKKRLDYTLSEINQEISLGDVKVISPRNDAFAFFDENNKEVFRFGDPYLYEEKNNEHKSGGIKMFLDKNLKGYSLRKSLTSRGVEWMESPERQYPIVIDPSVVISGGVLLSELEKGPQQRKVAFANSRYWVVYEEEGVITQDFGNMIYFRSTDATGTSWDAGVSMDTSTPCDGLRAGPGTWLDGNNLYVVWNTDAGCSATTPTEDDTITFRPIDTSNNTLGTKCWSADLGALDGDNVNTIVKIGSTVYVLNDSDPDLQTNTNQTTCTGGTNWAATTTGSGVTGFDRPVYDTNGTDLYVFFQDGQLSFSRLSGGSWSPANLTVSTTTSDRFAAANDGTSIFLISINGTAVDLHKCTISTNCDAGSEWVAQTQPWTGLTTPDSVSLTLDTSAARIYAMVVHGTAGSATAHSKDSPTSSISWGSDNNFGWAAGTVQELSSVYSVTDATKVAVVLLNGTNYEFATVPENLWVFLLALPWLPKVFKKIKKKRRTSS